MYGGYVNEDFIFIVIELLGNDQQITYFQSFPGLINFRKRKVI